MQRVQMVAGRGNSGPDCSPHDMAGRLVFGSFGSPFMLTWPAPIEGILAFPAALMLDAIPGLGAALGAGLGLAPKDPVPAVLVALPWPALRPFAAVAVVHGMALPISAAARTMARRVAA